MNTQYSSLPIILLRVTIIYYICVVEMLYNGALLCVPSQLFVQ